MAFSFASFRKAVLHLDFLLNELKAEAEQADWDCREVLPLVVAIVRMLFLPHRNLGFQLLLSFPCSILGMELGG